MRRSTVVARVSSCRFHRSFRLKRTRRPRGTARRLARPRFRARPKVLGIAGSAIGAAQPQERMHKREVWRRLRIGGVSAAVRRLAGAVRLSALVSPDSDAVGGRSRRRRTHFRCRRMLGRQEDLQGLADLGDESIQMLDTTRLLALDRERASGVRSTACTPPASSARRTGTVIIYVSMHGVVDAPVNRR